MGSVAVQAPTLGRKFTLFQFECESQNCEQGTGDLGNSEITSVFMPPQRTNTLSGKAIAALICCAALAWAAPSRAADLVSVGSVDATSANLWPLHIAQKNGYFDAANLKIDLV